MLARHSRQIVSIALSKADLAKGGGSFAMETAML
jgi:hypothetical protein